MQEKDLMILFAANNAEMQEKTDRVIHIDERGVLMVELTKLDIECNTFCDAEAVIKKATAKIEGSRNIKERQYYAQDVFLESKTLSICPDYNSENPNCLSCRPISHRRIREYENLAKAIES